MVATTRENESKRPDSRGRSLPPYADRAYIGLPFAASLTTLLLIVAIGIELTIGSVDSIHAFGWTFFVRQDWDPVRQVFSALSFILGTLYTSFWALLLAVPISVGAAIYLAEMAPAWIRTPASFLIELLA